MKRRCYNPRSVGYKDYGGRGVVVCDRWKSPPDGYSNFIADMGYRPSENHSIDRIDNSGNYEPANCRWVLRAEQANNKRSSRMIEAFGESLTAAQWSRRFGVHGTAIVSRLKCGWSNEDAVSKPYVYRKVKRTLEGTPAQSQD